MKKLKLKTNQKAVGIWALVAAGAGVMMYNSEDPMGALTELIKMLLMMQ
ncbi:hypothetical protein Ac42p027 [Acinetobacter phage Ac42]|nr:hypothetical protein Ac42p027 [Acinetobacter phage Ac42]ADI96265.1 hypothetical protein Ac42p027 [Acinetobacter phage Ac42]